jgi:hypothetical protein
MYRIDDDMLWISEKNEAEIQGSKSNKCNKSDESDYFRYNKNLCKDEKLACTNLVL